MTLITIAMEIEKYENDSRMIILLLLNTDSKNKTMIINDSNNSNNSKTTMRTIIMNKAITKSERPRQQLHK